MKSLVSSQNIDGGGVNLLITGGTGFVGKAVLVRLVDQPRYDKIYMLVRSRPGASSEERVARMVGQMFPKERASQILGRVQAVEGDFTLPGLGLKPEDLDLLRTNVHQILHCGASTEFGAPLKEARLNNTEGTLRVLEVATTLRQTGVLKRLEYISTAYVCGTKRGVVTEADLDRRQEFSNSYEQSKFEAEVLVSQFAKDLPITVYRPSIVVGNSHNGYTPHFKVLYWPILLMSKNLVTFIFCNKRAYLDVVPVDFVADSIVALMQQDSTIGQTYLLTAGLGREIRIGDILRDSYEWAGITKRPAMPFWLFDIVSKTPLAKLLPEKFWDVANLAKPYYSYLRGNAVRFDATNTLKVLRQLDISPPKWQDYKREILSFCLTSRWGKRLPLPEYSYYLPARLGPGGDEQVVS